MTIIIYFVLIVKHCFHIYRTKFFLFLKFSKLHNSGKSEVGEFFRLRIGKYRAIFKIDKNIITILVLYIGSHGDIFKK